MDDWSDLLFKKHFRGAPNQPFEHYLRTKGRLLRAGHSASSVEAHERTIKALQEDDWAALAEFQFDAEQAEKDLQQKLSQIPVLHGEELATFRQHFQGFALRKQAKAYISRIYGALFDELLQQRQHAPEVDWQLLLYQPDSKGKTLFDSLDAIALRVFWKEEAAREAADAALKKMQADDWHMLSSYSGEGSAAGFFRQVFRSRIQDAFRAFYGSCEPRVWIRNAGPAAIKMFKTLCCQKVDVATLLANREKLLRDFEGSETDQSQLPTHEALSAIARLILQKEPNCQERKFEEINESDSSNAEQISPLQLISTSKDNEESERMWELTLTSLQVLTGYSDPKQLANKQKPGDFMTTELMQSLTKVLKQLGSAELAKLQLKPLEKLTLQHRYFDNLTRNAVADKLGKEMGKSIASHQIKYYEETALGKLKKLLAHTGLGADQHVE